MKMSQTVAPIVALTKSCWRSSFRQTAPVNRLRSSLLAIGLGVLFTTGQPVAASQQSLQQSQPSEFFETVPDGAVTRLSTVSAATRQRNVRLNLDLLQKDHARPQPVRKLSFRLFDDVSVSGLIQSVELVREDGYIVVLDVDKDPHGHIYLSVVGQAMTATFRFNDQLYQVHHVGGGEHTVSLVDESKVETCGTPNGVAGHAVPDQSHAHNGDGGLDAVLDMLVVYTDDARRSNGGASGINSLINLAVFETNQGYAGSEVELRVNLVHTREVAFDESSSNMITWVKQLYDTSDGVIDQVHKWRDDYGADAVSMIVDSGQYCGVAAWVMTTPSRADEFAFNVTKDSCATGYYSFGHELGHCLSCQHDPANAGGARLYPWCYGYRTANNAYRTVMAYSPGRRINIWSNPRKFAPNNEVLGVHGVQENYRVITDVAAIASSWRKHRDVGHSLTTTLAGNTVVAGSMFDLQPKDDITLWKMDVALSAPQGRGVDIRVWYRPDSYVGHENSQVGWCVLATTTVSSSGNALTPVLLPNTKTLRAGRTYGIYVQNLNPNLINRYALKLTSGGPSVFENNHLKVTCGISKNSVGTTAPNMIWNGRIYYRGGAGSHRLKTTFAGTNGNTGNMFMVRPKVDLTINSFDVNIQGTGFTTIDVWYREGTYVGFEKSRSAWTFVGTDGKALSAGAGRRTRITVGDIHLTAGKLYSLFVNLGTYNGHILRYSTGNATYANSHMKIIAGVGRGKGVFSGSLFTDRTWNGRINYSISPFAGIGQGCKGLRQSGLGTAEIGTTTTYRLSGATPNRLFVLNFGTSTRLWGKLPLPFDLGLIGAPGCFMYQDSLISLGTFTVSSTGTANVRVRYNQCYLVGFKLFTQFMVLDPRANSLGIVTSNSMSTRLGD